MRGWSGVLTALGALQGLVVEFSQLSLTHTPSSCTFYELGALGWGRLYRCGGLYRSVPPHLVSPLLWARMMWHDGVRARRHRELEGRRYDRVVYRRARPNSLHFLTSNRWVLCWWRDAHDPPSCYRVCVVDKPVN